MKRSTKGLNAPLLRILLSVGLVLIAAIGVTIAYFANDWLSSYTSDIRKVRIEAEGSNANISNIEQLERKLRDERETVKRAAQIVADSQSYRYQNEIIRDIQKYASANNVGVASITFLADTATSAAAAGAAGTPATPSINGVKPTAATITLADEVDYRSALSFIRAIEQNLTKMQISSIGLSTPKPGNPSGTIRVDAINLEVYIKQ